ncbi:hypothetical protein COLO4_02512 [Corchorus olitorius]|uniref:Uncharacterized protein n=1 Tax=Corchorus olitorius TaxID=93759 RepID=A0A1R3L0Y1_9ROSI|nr:hypothetical protein COLO4_02512 [Corchorus olitorius]
MPRPNCMAPMSAEPVPARAPCPAIASAPVLGEMQPIDATTLVMAGTHSARRSTRAGEYLRTSRTFTREAAIIPAALLPNTQAYCDGVSP